MSTEEQPARVDLLVKALENFRDGGLSADLRPTMDCRDIGTLYAGFSDYLQRLDQQVRDVAQRALDMAAVPVAEAHRAEAWRVGAEWRSLHPHGLPERPADGAER